MTAILDKIKNYIFRFLNSGNSINEKNCKLVFLWSVPVCIALAFIFSLKGYGNSCILFTILTMIAAICGMQIAEYTNDHIYYSHIYCIVFNFFVNPIFFYMTGDIYNGVIVFMLLGYIVTVFMLSESKFVYLYVLAEFIYDCYILYFLYKNELLVLETRKEVAGPKEMMICFVVVAISIIVLFIYQTHVFNETARKLKKADRDIKMAESAKTRFLANMTHELRTPMNAIVAMTDLILKEELSKTASDHVNTIKNASNQLLKIVNNILEYSKIDSGRVEIVEGEYSFRKIMTEIIDSVSAEYMKDDITFHVTISKNIPDKLLGDHIKIKQVFKYLLFSSLNQATAGQVYLDINGDIDKADNSVKLKCRIASTGAGFSQNEINAIFNAYATYDSRQRTNYNGIGLELSICKAILSIMNGDLSIESIEGIGTAVNFSFSNYCISKEPIAKLTNSSIKFRPLIYIADKTEEYPWQKLMEEFKIPASYARTVTLFKNVLEEFWHSQIFIPDSAYEELKDILVSHECEGITYVVTDVFHSYGDFGKCKILRKPVYSINILEAFNNTWDKAKYSVTVDNDIITYDKARVLVVDDSSVNIKVLSNLLSKYNIKPTTAKSGMEAIDHVNKEEFDLILLDQKMPQMDGIETVHRIREMGIRNSNIPIICFTADYGADAYTRLTKEGFSDYLAKPVNMTYLSKLLQKYIPKELEVRTKVVKETEKPEEVKIDVTSFEPSAGIQNLGGSKEAYLSVLLTYYNEGIEKLETVPQQMASGDIQLYTTNVHALKSSSATVGALGISPLFKELEFAGKDNNTELINSKTSKVFEDFVVVLDKVKEYLISENALNTLDESIDEPEGEVVSLDKEKLGEMVNFISVMNLRGFEEILNEMISLNLGKDINQKIRDIKNNYENFEYEKAREIIQELL